MAARIMGRTTQIARQSSRIVPRRQRDRCHGLAPAYKPSVCSLPAGDQCIARQTPLRPSPQHGERIMLRNRFQHVDQLPVPMTRRILTCRRPSEIAEQSVTRCVESTQPRNVPIGLLILFQPAVPPESCTIRCRYIVFSSGSLVGTE